MEKFTHACHLDCADACRFDVYKEGNRVVRIEGNKENPFTKGIICGKGVKIMKRLYAEDRLKKPLLKIDGRLQEITFEEALEIMAEKMLNYREKYSSLSVAHYNEYGASGILKSIMDIFFNFYGGVTTAKGGNCWSAGIVAQNYDFGTNRTSDIDDVLNSKTVVMWGRNPANTSVHLYERLVQAKKKGIGIVTIDARKNETAKIADRHITVAGGTDGALAMAVTKYIIENKMEDSEFISNYVEGYEEYKSYLETLSMDYLLEETGVTMEEVRELAHIFYERPVTTFIGFGLQRYTNGGNSVRAIDALAAITGNIGSEGAGSFYANKVYSDILDGDPYHSEKSAVNSRSYVVADFASDIKKFTEDEKVPLKMLIITKSNMLNQMSNLNAAQEAFDGLEFKVCFDMFMTDTAEKCDLIIPVTNTLESEDMVWSSMHNPSLNYCEKVVEPAHPLMDEYFFFRKLAEIMEISSYPQVEKKEYLNRVLEPVNLKVEDLKAGQINMSCQKIAWADKKFHTPSGKVEIYSGKAEDEGQSPYPVYIPPVKGAKEYPLRLITPHTKDSLSSQHVKDIQGRACIYISEKDLSGFSDGETVRVVSEKGEIQAVTICEKNLKSGTCYIFAGWWKKHGNPNFLTNNGLSDMGKQTAYYDTFVRIEKI